MNKYTQPDNCTRTFYLIGLVFMLLNAGIALAGKQQDDPDRLFLQARELASQNNYDRAKILLNQILERHPEYYDASILKARIHAWEGEYMPARELLRNVLQKSPKNMEALYALIDVEMWSENYTEALRYLDVALAGQPNNTHLLYRKALALKEMGDETAAVVLLNQILDIDPSYQEAKELLENIKVTRLKNHFGAGYRGHYFLEDTDTDPWHLFYAELGRKTNFFGPLTARINVANRYNITNTQIEADAYPSIRPGSYLYLNFGYSPNKELFPVTRFGFEIFQALPASWEASAGFRLLNYQNKDLLVLTGSINKYLKKYYFSFRPYFSFSSEADAPSGQSYFLTIRRYFSSPDHYLSMIAGRGFSADFDKFLGGQIYDLGGTLAEVMFIYQQKVTTNFLFKLGAGYKMYDLNQSDAPFGNPVVVEGGIIIRF
jgi:YaiO family outer membrane protein